MFVLLVVVILLPNCLLTIAASNDSQYNALQFGNSGNDHIIFQYDMAPFRDSLSICTWMKRVDTSAPAPIVFDYYSTSSGNEIHIGSTGRYNQVVGDGGLNNLESKFTTPIGSWFSYCMTWSLATRTTKLYLDGDLIGTDQTPSGRTLQMGGKLGFNRLSYNPSSSFIFGGEIYQFNIYSNVLSSTAVSKIADGGLCFDLGEFSETRVLRWEDILDRSRSGSVRDIPVCELDTRLSKSQKKLADVTGWLNETKAQLSRMEEKLQTVTGLLNSTEEEMGAVRGELNSTQEELGAVRGELNSTEEELGAVRGELNSTQEELGAVRGELNSTQEELGAVRGELNSTQEELGAVRGGLGRTESQLQTETAQHNKTVERLETCSATLADTQSDLEGARTFQNITRWDVLYTAPYFNKEFTDELFQKLTSSWDMLRRFVGTNMTGGVVEHFRQYHREPVCDVFEQLSHTMLRHFMGVEITAGLIDHFKETHVESTCDSNTES